VSLRRAFYTEKLLEPLFIGFYREKREATPHGFEP